MPSGSEPAATPTTLEEASAALAAATREQRTVTIGENLRTDGLDRILEHEPGDLTCVVEAGVRLSALAAVIAPHRQRLALDPPGDPTVGACVAASLSGPLQHRFGSPRDLVLGVTLVLADGTIANAGGKVVKNVAGYDLGKLVCGSRGDLALIARVALRLHPVPAAAGTLVVETGEPADVAGALLRSTLQPSALDVLHPGRVAVLFEGSERAVGEQLETAARLVGGEVGGSDVWRESRERQAAAGGRIRFAGGSLAEVVAGLGAGVLRPAVGVGYVATPPAADVPEPLERLRRAVKEALDPDGTLAVARGEAGRA